jgi:malate dehydrogenase (oxaloacetate-decarboxylating)(NADP+)
VLYTTSETTQQRRRMSTTLDSYGEETGTQDQLVTPWNHQIASGVELLRNPRYNKGLAFTAEERQAHYLRGLLPPVIETQDIQVKRIMRNVRQYAEPIQKYEALMDLQERNERLFYKVLIENVEELLPIVYTPIEGDACEEYGEIFHRSGGLFISLNDKYVAFIAHAPTLLFTHTNTL